MFKNIVIINSLNEQNQSLLNLVEALELKEKNYRFSLLSANAEQLKRFKENHWPASKIYLGPNLSSAANQLIFFMTLPWLQFRSLVWLAVNKFYQRIDAIICLNYNEKIIFTLMAKLLKIKIFWLELPDMNYRGNIRGLTRLYRFNAKWAKIISFNSFNQLQLKHLGVRENSINVLYLGIKPHQYQDNLFNKLALADQKKSQRKYFTVGAIADLNHKQNIETLLNAVKISLPIAPNLQLVVIGEGRERKNLSWLAKKMEIDNLVWFVGAQGQLKKWLDNFDIFVVSSARPALDDYHNILEAMSAGLPVIGPRNIGLEDIVYENKTGSLIEADNSEMLARQIIKLHQDKSLRQQLAKNSQERVNKYFTIDKTTEKLAEILAG